MADLKAAALLMCEGGDDGDETGRISIRRIYNSLQANEFPFVPAIKFIGYVLYGEGEVVLEVRVIRNATLTRMNTAEARAKFHNGSSVADFRVMMYVDFVEPGLYTVELWHHETKLIEQVLTVESRVDGQN